MEAGWRLQRYDLGRHCNYEMAVWERFGEEASGGSERGSRKKKIRRVIWEEQGGFFFGRREVG